MASNKELTLAIATICAQLKMETPETKDLNNSQLSSLLKDFKAKQAEEAPGETEPEEAPEETGFKVMPRKAITTKRGIIAAGEKIEAKDLSGGEVAFKAFIKSKHIGRA
jgi:hypothetical protein